MKVQNYQKPKTRRINKSRHFRSFSINYNIIESILGEEVAKKEKKEKLATNKNLKPHKMSFKINKMLNNQKKNFFTKKINIDFVTEGEKEIKNSFFNLKAFRGVRIKEENLNGNQIKNFELKLNKKTLNDLEIIEEICLENENFNSNIINKEKLLKEEKIILKKNKNFGSNRNIDIDNFDLGKENLQNSNSQKKENQNFKTSVKENTSKMRNSELIKNDHFFIKKTIRQKKKINSKIKKANLKEKQKKKFTRLKIQTTKNLPSLKKKNFNKTPPYFRTKKRKIEFENKKNNYNKTSLQDIFITKRSNFKKFYEKFVDEKTQKRNKKDVIKKKKKKKEIKIINYTKRKTVNGGFLKAGKNTRKIDILDLKLDLKDIKKKNFKRSSKIKRIFTERENNYKNDSIKLKFNKKPLFIQTTKNFKIQSHKKKNFFKNYLKKKNKTFSEEKNLHKLSIGRKTSKNINNNFVYNKRKFLKKSYVNQKSANRGFGIFDFNIDKKKIVYRK